MFSLNDLNLFVVLADELHFGRAAARLEISTPTLSRRLSDLEERLSMRLFERSTHIVSLTAAGRMLLEPAQHSRTSLERFAATASSIASGQAGRLKVWYSPGTGVLMTALVRELGRERPELSVDYEQRVSSEVIVAVRNGEIDAGICRTVAPPGLSNIALRSEPFTIVACAVGHPLAKLASITLADLDGAVVLRPDEWPQRTGSDTDGFVAGFTTRLVKARTEEQFLDHVAAGEGVAFQTAGAYRANARADIVGVPYVDQPFAAPVVDRLIWRMDNGDPAVAAIAEVADALRS